MRLGGFEPPTAGLRRAALYPSELQAHFFYFWIKITEIKRLSTPGRRYYVAAKDIPTVKSGRGLVIVSTSKGMMTGSEAKKVGIGGELICKVF